MKTMTPKQAKELAEKGEILLVDVREGNEWASGRIPGSVHAPLSRFDRVVGGLPTDKQVVFYCASGIRSANAISLCQRLGLAHDTHMGGGIGAWMAHGFAVTR